MSGKPNLRAILLAASTLTGLVGMMIVDGVWDTMFLLLAGVPMGIGMAAGIVRGR